MSKLVPGVKGIFVALDKGPRLKLLRIFAGWFPDALGTSFYLQYLLQAAVLDCHTGSFIGESISIRKPYLFLWFYFLNEASLSEILVIFSGSFLFMLVLKNIKKKAPKTRLFTVKWVVNSATSVNVTIHFSINYQFILLNVAIKRDKRAEGGGKLRRFMFMAKHLVLYLPHGK